MIVKGDLLEINGERATADSDIYTRVIFNSYDLSILLSPQQIGTAVSCINVVYPSGIVRTVRFDNSKIRKIFG
jgi:hypothetical protein